MVRVVDGGGELHLPKLQWVSANVSLETLIGSDLFLAPPLPAIPDGMVMVRREVTEDGKCALATSGNYRTYQDQWDSLIAAGEVK